MASNYNANVSVNFKINSGSSKAVVNAFTRQLSSQKLNIPVNLKFKTVNTQTISKQNAAFRALNNTVRQLGISSSKSAAQLNSLYNAVKHVNSGLNNFGSSRGLQSFNGNVGKAAAGIKGVGNEFKQANHNVIGFSESVGISARRFLSFGLAAGVLAKVSYEIRNATVAALEFDHQMIRLKQTSGGADEGIAGIIKTISKLGVNLGVDSAEMSKTAVTLRQAGLSATETSKALTVLGKTSLSPSFEDVKSTTEGLIALFNQFDKNIDNLEKHFSAISKVSADFAVESSDLVEALKRTGGAFKSAGGNVNELLAMFTTIRQTTRESAESIATGMRTILARLQDPAIAKKLHGIGVEVYDLKGQFVGPYEAVERLSDALKKLPQGDIRASSILKDIGGLRQLSRVIPLVYNNDITTKALRSARGSMNKLDEDAKIAQESLVIQINRIKEGFLDLFRVISTDSSVRTTLQYIASGIEKITEAMRTLKPLIPFFLALGTIKVGQSIFQGYSTFKRGFTAPVKGYSQGGWVTGGTPGKDSVPAMLMPGEYVVPAKEARHLAKGGLVGSSLNRKDYRYERNMLAGLFKGEDGKKVYRHLQNVNAKFLDAGAEAAVFKNDQDRVFRIANIHNKPRRVDSELMLQALEERKFGQGAGTRFMEELPFTPPLDKTIKPIPYDRFNRKAYEESKANAERLQDQYVKEYATMATEQGYLVKDAHAGNIARVGDRLIAIDPNTIVEKQQELNKNRNNFLKALGFAKGGKVDSLKTSIENYYSNRKHGPGWSDPSEKAFVISSRIHRLNRDYPEALNHIPDDSHFIGAGISAVAFRTPKNTVIRIGGDSHRPKNQYMLQPLRSHTFGRDTLEELPYAAPIEETGISPQRQERIIRAFSKRLVREGLNPTDVHEGNVARYKKKFIAIDPGTFSEFGSDHEFAGNNISSLHFAKGGRIRFRGIPGSKIIDRLAGEASTPKGLGFAPFYDEYRRSNPLKGDNRKLFDEIYASQSMGALDKYVLGQSVNVYKKHKETNIIDASEYEPYLRKLGHNVPNRISLLQKVFEGKGVTTPKLGSYLQGLRNPNYFPIDRHVLGAVHDVPTAALSARDRKVSSTERNYLEDLLSKAAEKIGLSGQQTQAAIYGNRAKYSPKLEDTISILGGLRGYAEGGVVGDNGIISAKGGRLAKKAKSGKYYLLEDLMVSGGRKQPSGSIGQRTRLRRVEIDPETGTFTPRARWYAAHRQSRFLKKFADGGMVEGYRGVGKDELRELARIHREGGGYTSPNYSRVYFAMDEMGGIHGDLRSDPKRSKRNVISPKDYASIHANSRDAKGYLLNIQVPENSTIGSKYFGENSVPKMLRQYVKTITRSTVNEEGERKLGKAIDKDRFISRYNRMFHGKKPKGFARGGQVFSPHFEQLESRFLETPLKPRGSTSTEFSPLQKLVKITMGQRPPMVQGGKMFKGKIKGYAKGGSIFQPQGTDTVPAMLTPGEFVIPKAAAQKFGYDNLEKIRSGMFDADSLQRVRSRELIAERRKRRYNVESLYGNNEYKTLGEHLTHAVLYQRKTTRRLQSDYRTQTSPNFFTRRNISFKRYLRNLINEHEYKGILPPLKQRRTLAIGGEVGETTAYAYMAGGGIVPSLLGKLQNIVSGKSNEIDIDQLQEMLDKAGVNIRASEHIKGIKYQKRIRRGNQELGGFFDPKERQLVLSKKAGIQHVLHEFFHAVDYQNGKYLSEQKGSKNYNIAKQYQQLGHTFQKSLIGEEGLQAYPKEDHNIESYANAASAAVLKKALPSKELRKVAPELYERGRSGEFRGLFQAVNNQVKSVGPTTQTSSPPNKPPRKPPAPPATPAFSPRPDRDYYKKKPAQLVDKSGMSTHFPGEEQVEGLPIIRAVKPNNKSIFPLRSTTPSFNTNTENQQKSFAPFNPYNDPYISAPTKRPELPTIKGSYGPQEYVTSGGIIIPPSTHAEPPKPLKNRPSLQNILKQPPKPSKEEIDQRQRELNALEDKEFKGFNPYNSPAYGRKGPSSQDIQTKLPIVKSAEYSPVPLVGTSKELKHSVAGIIDMGGGRAGAMAGPPDDPNKSKKIYSSLSNKDIKYKEKQQEELEKKAREFLKPKSSLLPADNLKYRLAAERHALKNDSSMIEHTELGHPINGKEFKYFAKNNLGEKVKGVMQGNSTAHVEDLLRYKGLEPSKVKETLSSKLGLLGSPKDENLKRFRYTHMDENGLNGMGSRTVLANSESAARNILQKQGKFVTSIKQIDNTFSKRFVPTFSKWLGNTDSGLGKFDKKMNGTIQKVKSIGKGPGLLAASIAVPMLSENIFGNTKQPGMGGKAGVVAGNALSGAVTGASVGSMFGPWGTAIGALAGAALSAAGALDEFSEEAKQANFKQIADDLNSIKFNPQEGTFSKKDRVRFGNAIANSVGQGVKEQDTYTNRAYRELSVGGVAGAIVNPQATVRRFFSEKYEGERGKYTDLKQIPEQERETLSEAMKKAFMTSAQENPTKSYKEIADKLGSFKVGNNEYKAGEVLGLNFKNVEEVQRFIDEQKKAADIQNKMNAVMLQVNQGFELTAHELEAFGNALENSGKQYDIRQQYTEMDAAPLKGRLMAAPSNVSIGNLGGPGTVAGEIHSFSKAGGGYDQARQALLGIVNQLGKENIMNTPEGSLNAGIRAESMFKASGVGGKYSNQIGETANAIIMNTPNIHEKLQNEGSGPIVDQILGRFKHIKDTGESSNKELQKKYQDRLQSKVDVLDQQFEVRQQRSSFREAQGAHMGNQMLRQEALNPDKYSDAGNRFVSPEERLVRKQAMLQENTFKASQREFGAEGLNSFQIEGRYNEAKNRLASLTTQRQKAVQGGAGLNKIEGLDSEILKTQDTMRNFATALKNLAENTSNVEAAQKRYENAVQQFTADYESRKKDADVLAFGSRGDKMQLAMRENITQQALSMNHEQFASLPDQIKKIVYERLQETQGMSRTIQTYDKYGRERGPKDVTGEQALNYFRQPYLNALTRGTANDRLRGRAQAEDSKIKAAESNQLNAKSTAINMNQSSANQQAVQGQDNFNKYLEGINKSIADQMAATQQFLAGSAELTKALNNFDGKLTIERNGKVEVVLNGVAVLQAMKGDLEQEIMQTITKKLEEIKKQPAR